MQVQQTSVLLFGEDTWDTDPGASLTVKVFQDIGALSQKGTFLPVVRDFFTRGRCDARAPRLERLHRLQVGRMELYISMPFRKLG